MCDDSGFGGNSIFDSNHDGYLNAFERDHAESFLHDCNTYDQVMAKEGYNASRRLSTRYSKSQTNQQNLRINYYINLQEILDLSIDYSRSLMDYYEEYKNESFAAFSVALPNSDISYEDIFNYFTIGIINRMVNYGNLHEAFKIRVLDELFNMFALECPDARKLIRYPNVPPESIIDLYKYASDYTNPENPVGWAMLLGGASIYAEKDSEKVLKVSEATTRFLIAVDKYLDENNPNSGYGSNAAIYSAYSIMQVMDGKIISSNILIEMLQKHSIEEMKEAVEQHKICDEPVATVESDENESSKWIVSCILFLAVIFLLVIAVKS